MPGQYLIYGLTDPRTGEIRYVGQSSRGLVRAVQHAQPYFLTKGARTHKVRWIRKLQREGLEYGVTVLEEVGSPNDLNLVETFWIAQLRGMGVRLTNATSGGDGARGAKRSSETRRKMSESKLGAKHYLFGKSRSVEERTRISRSLGGRPVVDSNGVVYYSLYEVARRTGFKTANIRKAIRTGSGMGCGRGRSGGLTFRYLCPEGSDVAVNNEPSGKE